MSQLPFEVAGEGVEMAVTRQPTGLAAIREFRLDDRPTEAELRRRIEEYLEGLHTTLWLDWDITSRDRREKAISFVLKLCTDLGLVRDG